MISSTRFITLCFTVRPCCPQLKLSKSLTIGLQGLQEELDTRKLERLESRLRNAPVLSLGF